MLATIPTVDKNDPHHKIKEIFLAQKNNRWRVAHTTADERIAKLIKLRDALRAREAELKKAIHADYAKHACEVDLTEIYPTLSEIGHTISHLKRWMRPQRVKTPLVLFGTRSEVRYEPKGNVLILSPWNYPFQLLMAPLIAAIAAGNCAMLKPSAKTAHTAAFLKDFIGKIFDENEIALIEGDHHVSDALLELPFDHIFFTGSPSIGKKVMSAAANNLASVTLELGGKSPVIIDETADIKKTAERILWGKYVNAGQTCVAPDYALVHESKVAEFVTAANAVLTTRYGASESERAQSESYCRLVSEAHAIGLRKVLDASVASGARIAVGGSVDTAKRFISPTILTGVHDDSPIMREEIFGPILPIISYKKNEEIYPIIRRREKPLALYIFSRNQNNIEEILANTTAGGTCINSLIIHVGNPELPFGGVGYSGLGNYHGLFGFKTFSHERAVLVQGGIFDSLKNFYPPYTDKVAKMIKMAIRFFT